MKEKIKYAVFLAIVVLVSFSTSYITTSLLHPNTQSNSQASNPQATTLPSSNVMHLAFDVHFDPVLPDYYVEVKYNQVIHNLTITYQYTNLTDGTNQTQTASYADYYPTFGAVQTIPNGTAPNPQCQIPYSIMMACSRTKPYVDSQGEVTGVTFDIYPKLNVTDVSGYS